MSTGKSMVEEIRKANAEVDSNPLACYSTRQLRTELKRREWRRKQAKITAAILKLGMGL